MEYIFRGVEYVFGVLENVFRSTRKYFIMPLKIIARGVCRRKQCRLPMRIVLFVDDAKVGRHTANCTARQ